MMNKKRYILFFWIGIGIILLLNILIWVYLNQVESRFSTELKTRLIGNNRSLSRLIDPETLSLLVPGQHNSPEYISTLFTYNSIREQDSLQSILLIASSGDLLVASPEALMVQTSSIDKESPAFKKALDGIFSITAPEKIAGSWFLSSYGPVFDPDGFVSAVQVIEARASYFDTLGELRGRLFLFSALTFVLIAIIATLLFRMIDRMMRYQSSLKDNEHLVQLGTMAASVAHELRNPLGIIEGSNDLIRRKYARDNNDEIFNYIPDEIKRLNHLIDDFLKFSRTPNLRISSVKLGFFLDKLKLNYDEAQSARFKLYLDEPDMYIKTDVDMLEQILLNILRNAFEASDENDMVEMRVTRFKKYIRFEIRDQGPGISDDIQKRIFMPFFTTKERGTGLGLAITQRAAHLLQGEVTLNSAPGHGAVFYIEIPYNLPMDGQQ